MQCWHTAQWHNRLKHSGKAGMPFRTTSGQDNPTWRTTQSNSFLPCWMLKANRLHMSKQRKSEYVTKLCSTFCMTFWVTANLQRVGYPWNFQGATMAPLCSRTGLVGPIPKGRWWLSCTNHRYERNLGSLIWTKLEMSIKWMVASQFSFSKESAPYTMCCKGDVHCGK